MEEQDLDLELEKIIEEEFGTFQKPVIKSISYEEEFEAKKKLIQNGMKALFVTILMIIIILLRFTGAFTGIDIIVDAIILVATMLTILYVYAFFRELRKK